MEKSVVFAVFSSLAMAAVFGAAYIFRPRRPAPATPTYPRTPDGFAAAWNARAISIPDALVCSIQDPSGVPVTVFPWCDAIETDGGVVVVSLTMPPVSPIGVGMIPVHAEAVRQTLRDFFQVGQRPVAPPHLSGQTCALSYAPVRPERDADGRMLLGFDDVGAPVRTPIIGEITAISGDTGGAVEWLRRCHADIPYQSQTDTEAVIEDTVQARQMQLGPMLVDVGDCTTYKQRTSFSRPYKPQWVADVHRGIIERSTATIVDAEKWGLAPTQTITRVTPSVYELERDGRKWRFTPAWLY